MPYTSLTSGSSSAGGYQSLAGSGYHYGSPASGLGPEPEQDLGILGTILNIPSNLVGGAARFVTGLGQLGGTALHDVGHAAALGLPGGQDWGPISDNPDQTFQLDDIGKSIIGLDQPGHPGFHPTQSVVAQDYAKRYGMLAEGDVGGFLKGIAEDPFSFVLDAGAVASGAAKGAGIAGRSALKGTEAAGVAASTLAETTAAGVGGRAALAGSTRAGLDALAEAGTLSPLLRAGRHFLPSESFSLAGKGVLTPTVEPLNPFTRAVYQGAKRLGSDDLNTVLGKVDELKAEIASYPIGASGIAGENAPMGLRAEYGRLKTIADQAEDLGLKRLDNPTLQKFNDYRAMGKLVVNTSADHLLARNAATEPYRAAIVDSLKRDPAIEQTFAERAQLLDLNIAGHTPAGTVPVRAAERTIGGLEPPAGGVTTTIDAGAPLDAASATLDDAQRAAGTAVNAPLVARYDTISTKLDDFVAQVEAKRDALTEAGWNVDDEIDGALRMKRALTDGLKRRLAADAEAGPGLGRASSLDENVRLMDEVRLINAEHRAALWDTDAMRMTPGSMMERTYRPFGIKQGFYDNGEWSTDWRQVDDLLHNTGVAQPVYFPHLDPERMGSNVFFRSRSLKGANILAADKHMRQLKGALLKEGSYERNPLEAYTRMAASAVRETETYETMAAMVHKFGIRVDNAESLPGDGWTLVSPDAMFFMHRTRRDFLTKIDKYMNVDGMDKDSALAKATSETIMRTQDDLHSILGKITNEDMPAMYAVPKVVADRLGDAAKWSSFTGKNTRLFWDTPLHIWRSMVLTGSPRWIVNNMLGNTIFGVMQGAKTADVMRVLTERLRAMTTEWVSNRAHLSDDFTRALKDISETSPDSWFSTAIRPSSLAGRIQELPGWEKVGSGFIGTQISQYDPKLGRAAAETRTGRLIEKAQAAQGRTATGIRSWGDAMRHLNGEVESAFRDVSYLTAAEKQVTKGVITRTGRQFWRGKDRIDSLMRSGFDDVSELGMARVNNALKEVNHFFGDYTRMSPFERHVIRRFAAPFWGFYRHQIKLLTSFPFDQPLRASVLKGLGEATQELIEQYGPLPEWLQGAIPMGPPGDVVPFMSSRGPNPFSGTFDSPISMLSPPLKMFLERSQGRNSFTGKAFTDEDIVTPYGSDQSFRLVKDSQGNVVDAIPVDKPLPGIIEQALQNIPQYGALKDSIAGGATYDTASLLSILTGGGTIRDPETGAPKYPTNLGNELQALGGFGQQEYDVGAYQDELERQRQAALTLGQQRFGGV